MSAQAPTTVVQNNRLFSALLAGKARAEPGLVSKPNLATNKDPVDDRICAPPPDPIGFARKTTEGFALQREL